MPSSDAASDGIYDAAMKGTTNVVARMVTLRLPEQIDLSHSGPIVMNIVMNTR